MNHVITFGDVLKFVLIGGGIFVGLAILFYFLPVW